MFSQNFGKLALLSGQLASEKSILRAATGFIIRGKSRKGVHLIAEVKHCPLNLKPCVIFSSRGDCPKMTSVTKK